MEKPSDNVTLASSLDPITFDCDGLRESREVTSRDFRRDPVRCASLERREPDLAEALSWELLRAHVCHHVLEEARDIACMTT